MRGVAWTPSIAHGLFSGRPHVPSPPDPLVARGRADPGPARGAPAGCRVAGAAHVEAALSAYRDPGRRQRRGVRLPAYSRDRGVRSGLVPDRPAGILRDPRGHQSLPRLRLRRPAARRVLGAGEAGDREPRVPRPGPDRSRRAPADRAVARAEPSRRDAGRRGAPARARPGVAGRSAGRHRHPPRCQLAQRRHQAAVGDGEGRVDARQARHGPPAPATDPRARRRCRHRRAAVRAARNRVAGGRALASARRRVSLRHHRQDAPSRPILLRRAARRDGSAAGTARRTAESIRGRSQDALRLAGFHRPRQPALLGRRLHRAGESLRYGCWHDNGATFPARLGCQDTPGVPPGALGAPAAECTTSCSCVAANLVAGPTPDDEICALAGYYYEAAPGGSCDVSGLPAIN